MGKRSEFERVEKDFYATIDKRAVLTLLPHITHIRTFSEPCCGKRHLIETLEEFTDIKCVHWSDIDTGKDALTLTVEELNNADCIITNPPWSRHLLHPLILHLKDLAPTYLLLDADWSHTKQAIPYMKYCTDIYSVGRLIWMEGTNTTGKDNCCWYRFAKDAYKTNFHTK